MFAHAPIAVGERTANGAVTLLLSAMIDLIGLVSSFELNCNVSTEEYRIARYGKMGGTIPA